MATRYHSCALTVLLASVSVAASGLAQAQGGPTRLVLDIPGGAGMPQVDAAPVTGVEAVPLEALSDRLEEALSAADEAVDRAVDQRAAESALVDTPPTPPVLPSAPAAPSLGSGNTPVTSPASVASPARAPDPSSGTIAAPATPSTPRQPVRPAPPAVTGDAVDLTPSTDLTTTDILGGGGDILGGRRDVLSSAVGPAGTGTGAGAMDVLLPITGTLCRRLVAADPGAATYQPDVGSRGQPLAPATVDGGAVESAFQPPPVVEIQLTAPLADRLDLPQDIGAEAVLSAVGIDTATGALTVNGQPLLGEAVSAIRSACRMGLEAEGQP